MCSDSLTVAGEAAEAAVKRFSLKLQSWNSGISSSRGPKLRSNHSPYPHFQASSTLSVD